MLRSSSQPAYAPAEVLTARRTPALLGRLPRRAGPTYRLSRIVSSTASTFSIGVPGTK